MRQTLTAALLLAAIQAHSAPLTTPVTLAQIAALPRLTAQTPAALRINADLAARDGMALADAAACTVPTREDGTLVTDQTGSWERSVAVTLSGQALLSILIIDEAWCPGAAHGFTVVTPLTWSLPTGLAVDWPALLPPDWTRNPQNLPGDAGSHRSQAMTDYYHAHYPKLNDPDCADVELAQQPSFRFWPDAASHRLVMQPAESSHGTRACDDAVLVSPTELAALRADASLIAALTER